LNSGVRVYRGTPTLPLAEPALFLGIVNSAKDGRWTNTIASLSLARPGGSGYAIKELISNMELDPEGAVEKAIDIAVRGGIKVIYLNADLEKLPAVASQTG
jgi:hypothetical protein